MHRLLLLTPILLCLGCDVGDLSKTVTEGAVSTAIEATKGVADGFNDGVAEGRKGATSVDGSQVLSTHAEIASSTQIDVIEVLEFGDRAQVVLSVENLTHTPVHLIGLHDEGGALLIDGEGFATRLDESSLEALGKAIEVPPNAKVKATLVFEAAASEATAVRVWGQDLPVL